MNERVNGCKTSLGTVSELKIRKLSKVVLELSKMLTGYYDGRKKQKQEN